LFFLFIPLLPQQNQQEEPTASAKVQFNVSKIYRWRFGMHSAPNMGNKPHKQKKNVRKRNKIGQKTKDQIQTETSKLLKPSEKKAQTKPTKIVQNMLSCKEISREHDKTIWS